MFTYDMFCLGMRSNVDFVVDIIIFEHIESVYFVCHKIFCKRNGSFFLNIICKQIYDLRFVYKTTTFRL